MFIEKGFWARLERFVKEIEVSDPISEEEKEYILRVCRYGNNREKRNRRKMMQEFIFSFYANRKVPTYKTAPHPIWWRRLLGQTIHYQNGHREFKESYKVAYKTSHPEGGSKEFQEGLKMAVKAFGGEMLRLEMGSVPTDYLTTTAHTELPATNYLLNSEDV